MLDLQVADMKSNQVKKGPTKDTRREPKEKDPETEAGKKLQKDIKALLNWNSIYVLDVLWWNLWFFYASK